MGRGGGGIWATWECETCLRGGEAAEERASLTLSREVCDEGNGGREADSAERGDADAQEEETRRRSEAVRELACSKDEAAELYCALQSETGDEQTRRDREHQPDDHEEWSRLRGPPTESIVDVVIEERVEAAVGEPDEAVGARGATEQRRTAK